MLLQVTCALLLTRWLDHLAAHDDVILAQPLFSTTDRCCYHVIARVHINARFGTHIHVHMTVVTSRTSDVRYEQARSSDRRIVMVWIVLQTYGANRSDALRRGSIARCGC